MSQTAPAPDRYNPRNPWTKARQTLDLIAAGRLDDAARRLEMIRYDAGLPEEAFGLYAAALDAARRSSGLPPRINLPCDYTGSAGLGLRRPFRRVPAGTVPPHLYPAGMALPPLAGPRNDYAFLRDAATVLAPAHAARRLRVDVVLDAARCPDTGALVAALAAQDFDGDIRLHVLAPGGLGDLALPDALSPRMIGDDILGLQANSELRRMLEITDSDITVFLGGEITLDPGFMARAVFLARVSDTVVQPLVPFEAQGDLRPLTTWLDDHALARSRFPYRDMEGLNFVAPTALMRRAGLPETRFSSTFFAAREIAFRMHQKGAYFAPLAVPHLVRPADDEVHSGDGSLFVALCPSHWDRKKDAAFERPRVNVYIPAYNASKYICRAVDSVLEQDVKDVDVCIADDGSSDGTADVLRQRYEDTPRVRVQSRPNGGIGHASNRAIALGRAPYIGQLDSDDCLKPGAVRRLMEVLDENPGVVCAYGSCERIDAKGAYMRDEYSWPVFTREKMMITSIAHHFRMFRRAAWERTTGFREDIVNAVDYDIFLKLAETGDFHHVEEILYQRRWHGENTSSVNEGFQTRNTHVVQKETLGRLGLDRFWQVDVPDPSEPRRVSYARKPGVKTVMFWPNYSRVNPYQHMLYGPMRDRYEVCAGDIDAALEQIETFQNPADLTFHLHWINFVLNGVTDPLVARAEVDLFLHKLSHFVALGGRLVWTIHNTLSHDTPFAELEREMSPRIAALAHRLHFHSAASVDEVARAFYLPRDKVVVSRHGHYIGAYPDFVPRARARAELGLAEDDEVILFSGQVRPYKGVEALIAVFRSLLAERPRAVLLIVGEVKFDLLGQLAPALSEAERARIRLTNRFVDDMELQVFLRAADIAVYPYQNILTSGSLLLALSFGVPAVVPAVGMTRDVLEGRDAGALYDADQGQDGLAAALREMLAHKDSGRLEQMSRNARALAQLQSWPDFAAVIEAAQPDAPGAA
ncbi:glycosyltransferase [Sulfitobacter sp. HNIBRBA3233]|uniref:glycosyltransferase n=1 Tax=Sulfitobacter marinivivus TaxID=3158558 RepID=UPI0032DF6F70